MPNQYTLFEKGSVSMLRGDSGELLSEVMKKHRVNAVITEPPQEILTDYLDQDCTKRQAWEWLEWLPTGIDVAAFHKRHSALPRSGLTAWGKFYVIQEDGSVSECSLCTTGPTRERVLWGDANFYFIVAGGDGCKDRQDLEAIEYLVRRMTKPDDLVVDPFMGYGTTAIACARLGRRCIGIEQDATIFETACARLEAVGVK